MLKTILLVIALTAIRASALAVDGGDITFKPAGIDPVHFNHDYHLKTRGLKCSACHFLTFARDAGSFQIKKEKLNKRDFCGHCHNGMKGFDAGSDKNCTLCHKKGS